jgi:hypothetical protein
MKRFAIEMLTCHGCARPLETYSYPLRVEEYVPCVHCAHLYLVTEAGLERVDVATLDPVLREFFNELVAGWWRDRINDVEGAVAA